MAEGVGKDGMGRQHLEVLGKVFAAATSACCKMDEDRTSVVLLYLLQLARANASRL